MATNEEFQVRTLYDFTGQDESELNFQANEILTITSTSTSDGWWFATNVQGKAGAIPANYVEKIQSTETPVTTGTSDLDLFALGDQTTSQTQYQYVPEQQQTYTEPSPISTLDWSAIDPLASLVPSANAPTEQHLAPTTSDASVPNTNTIDPYITVTDYSTVSETVQTGSLIDADPPTSDYSEDWYSQVQTPVPAAPVASTNFSNYANQGFDFDSETTNNTGPSTSHTITSLDDDNYIVSQSYPASPPMATNYDTPMPLFGFSEQSNTTQSVPVQQPPKAEPLASPPAALVTDKVPASPSGKKVEERSGFFTLRRQKKGEDKKRRKSIDIPKESSTQPIAKNGADSDSFSDSGNHTTNAIPKPSPENKPAAKARFFDKHGLDNYILNGTKIKSDEHVEIAYDERNGGVYFVPNATMPPFAVRVEEPATGTKLGGIKKFIEYKIHSQVTGERIVNRRYKHFDWLHERLVAKFRFICIPPLPGKQISGRFEDEFVQERRRQLELWLNRICRHPVLCASFPVQHFVTCELTEKNNKEWKAGKRRVEKDESRDAPWLHCVTVNTINLNETQINAQIETFAQQQPALEAHTKILSQGLTKYLERHGEIYERDVQRIGELFSKLHSAVEVDTTTPGNQQLANSIGKISESYNAVAELYKTKAIEGLRYFNEHLQEFIGVLIAFPAILAIQRSAVDFIRSIQQRGPSATADYNGAIQRNNAFNHVILAEINLFQRDKILDLNAYMKTVMIEQIEFYEKIAEKLRAALATFP